MYMTRGSKDNPAGLAMGYGSKQDIVTIKDHQYISLVFPSTRGKLARHENLDCRANDS